MNVVARCMRFGSSAICRGVGLGRNFVVAFEPMCCGQHCSRYRLQTGTYLGVQPVLVYLPPALDLQVQLVDLGGLFRPRTLFGEAYT